MSNAINQNGTGLEQQVSNLIRNNNNYYKLVVFFLYVFNEFKIRGWQNGEFLFCVKQRIDFITFLWVPMHKRGGDTTTTRSWNEKITHSPLTQVTASKQKKFQRQKERQKINWLLASSVLRGEWLRLYLCLTDFISF